MDWYYPRRLRLCNDYINLFEPLRKSPELKRKSERSRSSMYAPTCKGCLMDWSKVGSRQRRAAQRLESLIAKHPDHAASKQAIDNLAKHYERYRSKRDADAALRELLFYKAWWSRQHDRADG